MNQKLQLLTSDELLRDIANSYFETNEDFYHLLSDYSLSFPHGTHYLALAFQTMDTDGLSGLREVLSKTLDEAGYPYLLFYYANNTYTSFFSFPNEASVNEFHSRLSSLHAQILDSQHADICIGIGKDISHAKSLPLSCQQALHALSFKIIRGAKSVNPFDSTLQKAHFIQTVPEALWDTYRRSLLQSNFSSTSHAVQKIFQYMTDISDMPILGIQINTLNLIMTCIGYLSESPTFPVISYENTDFLKQISSFQTADELEKYAQNIIYNLVNNNNDAEIARPTELISKVENYINENYLEDLSLIHVAQVFYISPIYLSQTFKKQTGQLYLDYVTQVKISAAQKMLLTTNLMVYEIADRLHYKDSKYFSKLFEKKTGKKPSEFRKSPN